MAKVLQIVAGVPTLVPETIQIPSYLIGQPGDDVIILAYIPAEDFEFAEDVPGSTSFAGVAPGDGDAVYTVKKNGVSIGTITFPNGVENAVFDIAATSFEGGVDELTVSTPTPQDSTLSDVRFTLYGTRP